MLMGALRKFFQEVVVPELEQIRAENAEVKTALQLTNKRLDDLNAHLVDQSRRIDAVRVELTEKIDLLRIELAHRLDETHKRIDAVREELAHKIDETNDRLNRLYEVVVRREEHEGLAQRVARLEQKVEELMARLAA